MEEQKQILHKALRRLGYRLQDIQPVDIYQVQQTSVEATKNMNEIEKQFYILRKSQALQAQRKKTIKEVDKQINNLQRYSVNHKRRVNPIVLQLINQHQKKCDQKFKYLSKLQTIRKRKTSELKFKNEFESNSLDINRQSSRTSQSRRTSESKRSRISKLSNNSKNSEKQKLIEVRKRELQIIKYRKQLYKRKMETSQKKIKRVYEQLEHRSKKIKTKSEISKQIVFQNLKDIREEQASIRNSRLEKLNSKQLRGLQKSTIEKRPLNQTNYKIYKDIKRNLQDTFKEQQRYIYERKMKKAQMIKLNNDKQLRQSLNMSRQTRQGKLRQMKQILTFHEKQQKQNNLQTLGNYNNSLIKATIKKKEQLSKNKFKCLEMRIKEQITQKNRNILNQRRSIQTQNKMREWNQKQRQISEIQKMKRYLLMDRKMIGTQNKKRTKQNYQFLQQNYL